MSANSFGERFKITSFGESHGPALGVVIDGCPAGLDFDFAFLVSEMARRRPGVKTDSGIAPAPVSERQEPDQPEILSGVFEGKTLGTPIAILVRNQDARSDDYKDVKMAARSGHADDVWQQKFAHRDYRGGGRSSGRETVARVMAGAVAKMLLRKVCPELKIRGFAAAIGPFELTPGERESFLKTIEGADQYAARFPSIRSAEVKAGLEKIKAEHNSWGGIAEVRIQGMPPGLGQPVFHKLKSDLAMAMTSIGASSGFELGDGLHEPEQSGKSFHADPTSKAYGGIRGGISTGDEIGFKVHFKPTSSIMDVAKKGRHDPCIVIRAIPVVEAMTALVLIDHWLWQKTDRL